MAFCIIANGSDTNHLFATMKQCIENSILREDGDYEYIDLNEFDFRRCTRDKCIDLEVDNYSGFGCKKSKECIMEHNREVTEKVYVSILDCENIVFLIDASNSRGNLFKFRILARELREKLYSEENAWRLFFRKRLIYVVVDDNVHGYFDVSMVDDLIREFDMECIDAFFINQKNVDYMLDVLEVAIPSLNKYA